MLYDYTQYIDSIKNLAIRDYYIVTGIAGSRTDLVTGWLSACHPRFHSNHQWAIDPTTGASTLVPASIFNHPGDANVDQRTNTQQRIQRLGDWAAKLPPTDPNATKSVVGKSHMRPWMIVDGLTPEKFVENFTIVVIDTTTVSDRSISEKITWEFVAKTFLSNCRRVLIETNLEELQNHSRKVFIDDNYRMFLGKYSTQVQDRIIYLDYEKIITPEGGEYICERLGLTPEKWAIENWKKVLPLTHTNQVVNIAGEEWSLSRILPEQPVNK